MNHVTLCKIVYAFYTPFQNLKLKLKGVATKGIVYTSGSLFISKANNSSICIGGSCRFMSKSWGNKIGLYHQCMLSTESGAKLTIGNHCSFSGTSIWCFNKITIGNDVRVGANCSIMDGDAHQDDPRAGKNAPIMIENNVWLCANVVVTKGVTIGRNSIVGINSLVLKDVPANVVVAGNPCRVIRNLTNEEIYKIECK